MLVIAKNESLLIVSLFSMRTEGVMVRSLDWIPHQVQVDDMLIHA